ncbi:MAG TPA: hypothetical protein VIG38_14830 [Hyphomicrobium sp.]|jgi:hypothetical protein
MKANDKKLREDALRFGAYRICLWRLCRKPPCVRARACCGDAGAWRKALDGVRS